MEAAILIFLMLALLCIVLMMLLILASPVVGLVAWTLRFVSRGQHSLRELFWLMTWWAMFFAWCAFLARAR